MSVGLRALSRADVLAAEPLELMRRPVISLDARLHHLASSCSQLTCAGKRQARAHCPQCRPERPARVIGFRLDEGLQGLLAQALARHQLVPGELEKRLAAMRLRHRRLARDWRTGETR